MAKRNIIGAGKLLDIRKFMLEDGCVLRVDESYYWVLRYPNHECGTLRERIFCPKLSVNVTNEGEEHRSTSQKTEKKELVHQWPRAKQEVENERQFNQLFRGKQKAEKEKQIQKFVRVKREAEKWQVNQLPWAKWGAKMWILVLVQRICLSWIHKILTRHSLAYLPRFVNISSTSVFFRLIINCTVPSFLPMFSRFFLSLLFSRTNRSWQLRFVEEILKSGDLDTSHSAHFKILRSGSINRV